MGRFLLSIRRTVPAERIAEYRAAWADLCDAVQAGGGHAWLFRSAAHPHVMQELIEWQQPAATQDAAHQAAVAPRWIEAARLPLGERFGTGEVEVWEEIP